MSHFFESQVGPIHYSVHGNKSRPTVLLLHGLGGSMFNWRNITPNLINNYQVISLDLWGFGMSSKEMDQPLNLDSQTQVIKELLKYLKVDSYHVVGHSMGGAMAIWLKTNDSEVKKCIAITPASYPSIVSDWLKIFSWIAKLTPILLSKKHIKKTLERLLEKPEALTDDIISAYHEPYKDPKAHLCFAKALNIIKDPRLFDSLTKTDSQTHVIWVANDKVISKKWIEKMSENLNSERILTHPWSGHLPMEDDPNWLNDQLDSILKT